MIFKGTLTIWHFAVVLADGEHEPDQVVVLVREHPVEEALEHVDGVEGLFQLGQAIAVEFEAEFLFIYYLN
jgi:hypothetical protein